jgi:sodium pump decarboxylase gamma subunit
VTNIEQGLTLMVLGFGITFSALAILIGLIVLLGRVFPAAQESGSLAAGAADQPTVSQLLRDTAQEEVAAAIAMALAHVYSLELCRSNLGETLEHGPGQWWTMGQVEVAQSGYRGGAMSLPGEIRDLRPHS